MSVSLDGPLERASRRREAKCDWVSGAFKKNRSAVDKQDGDDRMTTKRVSVPAERFGPSQAHQKVNQKKKEEA